MSHADSIDSVGMIGRLQCRGTVEMREVMQRHMVLNRLNSSTAAYISRAAVPRGSRMDSALSRIKIISVEDRNGRREVRSSGFSTPAPTTLESRVRKWVREGENWSHRMNRRLSPKRCLMRSWWRTVRATDVLPIPPGPMSATGVKFSARPTIFSIKSSRPQQVLGGGGGDSPNTILNSNVRY